MRSERFEMRLTPDTLEQVDQWRADQLGLPSRAEAVRRLIDVGLSVSSGEQEVTFSDGEKLILLMLGDVYRHLKIDRGNVDPELVTEAMTDGHYWALAEKLDYLFHNRTQDRRIVSEVRNVLDMWLFIEYGYAALSEEDKEKVKSEGGPFVKFRGFDQKYEPEYSAILRFLIDDMGQFTAFKGRDFYTVGFRMVGYRRMLEIFEPIRPTLVGVELSALQIINLLKAETPTSSAQKAT